MYVYVFAYEFINMFTYMNMSMYIYVLQHAATRHTYAWHCNVMSHSYV